MEQNPSKLLQRCRSSATIPSSLTEIMLFFSPLRNLNASVFPTFVYNTTFLRGRVPPADTRCTFTIFLTEFCLAFTQLANVIDAAAGALRFQENVKT